MTTFYKKKQEKKKGQYKLHNTYAVKARNKNYTNIHILAAYVRHCLASLMLRPQ